MPELPEVQTTVLGLQKETAGWQIMDVWTDYGSAYHMGKDNIKDPKFFSVFKKEVVGTIIKEVSRKAKNIIIHLSNDTCILVHMKMTGHMMVGQYTFDDTKKKDPWTPADTSGALADPFNKFIHVTFTLSKKNGDTPKNIKVSKKNDGSEIKQLVLSDMRKFAKVTLISLADLENSLHVSHIGPEPLEDSFTYEVFTKQIAKRSTGNIKTVLMDQSIIAGVGNIYSDEALWRAGINPEQKVKTIDQARLKKLYAAVKEVLNKGIDFGEDSMSDYRNIYGERGEFQAHHEAYRRTGKPCRKKGCGGTIQRKVVGGRSAHFCDRHQVLT